MQASLRTQGCLISFSFLYMTVFIVLMTTTNLCFAAVIELHGNQIISKSLKYKNDVLNLIGSRFTVSRGAVLEIENSTINIVITPDNPYFVSLSNGRLILKNNKVNVTAIPAIADANAKSKFQLIKIQKGSFNIDSNEFVNASLIIRPMGTAFVSSISTTSSSSII